MWLTKDCKNKGGFNIVKTWMSANKKERYSRHDRKINKVCSCSVLYIHTFCIDCNYKVIFFILLFADNFIIYIFKSISLNAWSISMNTPLNDDDNDIYSCTLLKFSTSTPTLHSVGWSQCNYRCQIYFYTLFINGGEVWRIRTDVNKIFDYKIR